MSLKLISEYNQTYRKHTSCYYCLGLTLCYLGQNSTNLAQKTQKNSFTLAKNKFWTILFSQA